MPRLKGITWGDFRRGFLATAQCQSFQILKDNASRCWDATPLEAVAIRWPRVGEGLETMPPIAGLRELTIQSAVVDLREVGYLAAAPLLSTVRKLRISDANLGDQGFRDLLASDHLQHLESLLVGSNSIGNTGIQALFNAPSLTSLEELDLSDSGRSGRYREDQFLGSPGLEALAAWQGMAGLRTLDLSGTDLSRDSLRALLRSPRATGLKNLVLRSNGLIGQAIAEFTDAHRDLQLDILDIGDNVLRDVGAEYLATAPCLRHLKVLHLDRCEILSTGARAVARARFLPSLRYLDVNDNTFGLAGMLALYDKTRSEENSPRLHTLRMVDNDVGDKGVAGLAESPASDHLLELDLSRNNLGPNAVQHLAQSNYLRQLLILTLYINSVDQEAVALLKKSPLGKHLVALDVSPDEIPF